MKEISESQKEFVVGVVYDMLSSLETDVYREIGHGDLGDEWLAILGELSDPEDIRGTDERLAKDMLSEYLFG